LHESTSLPSGSRSAVHFLPPPQGQYRAETSIDAVNGFLTKVNNALDKFQAGSGPLVGKGLGVVSNSLTTLEVKRTLRETYTDGVGTSSEVRDCQFCNI